MLTKPKELEAAVVVAVAVVEEMFPFLKRLDFKPGLDLRGDPRLLLLFVCAVIVVVVVDVAGREEEEVGEFIVFVSEVVVVVVTVFVD